MATEYGEDTTLTTPELREIAALLRTLATKTEADSREDLDADAPQVVSTGVGWMRKTAAKLKRVDSDLKYFYEPVLIGLIDGYCPMLAFSPEVWRKTAAALQVLETRLGKPGGCPRRKDTWKRVRRLAEKTRAIAEWWAGWHAFIDRLAEAREEDRRKEELEKARPPALPPASELVLDPEFYRTHPPGHAGNPAAPDEGCTDDEPQADIVRTPGTPSTGPMT